MRFAYLILLLALAPTGCAGRLALPTDGGPTWRLYEAGPVRLYTDAPEAVGRDLAGDFSRRYRAIVEMPFRCSSVVEQPPEVDVVLFFEPSHYEQVRGTRSIGTFVRRPLSARVVAPPLLIMSKDSTAQKRSAVQERVARLFQHELVHQMTLQCYPAMPPWLTEGLAEVFESVGFVGDRVRYGRPRRAVGGRLPAMDKLRSLDAREFYADPPEQRALHYYASWVLVHMLSFGHDLLEEPFRAYLAALANGTASEPDAWREHLGEFQLEQNYRAYAQRTRVSTMTRNFRHELPPVSSRELSDADVAALWARASDWSEPERRARAAGWLASAPATGPEAAEILLTRADMALWDGDVDTAKRLVVEAHRAAPAYQAALAGRVATACWTDGGDQSLDRAAAALEARAGNLARTLALACFHARRERDGRAERLLYEALARSPNCWECYGGMGKLLAARQRWDAAARAFDRAAKLVPHRLGFLRDAMESASDDARARLPDEPAEAGPPPGTSPVDADVEPGKYLLWWGF